jgi:fermentation-respiration switch protein FrsA (DUF1100 family)
LSQQDLDGGRRAVTPWKHRHRNKDRSATMSNATSLTTHVEQVHFTSCGVELAGSLHLPTAAGPVPAVVVTGTWTSVKEQMADRYAAALAARGYAALSFDFTGFGDSAGEPRDYESPNLGP